MLIDSLTFTLEKSGCLDAFWGKLDAGEDGTLGVASSARPFLVAARFAYKPQPTLVVWRRASPTSRSRRSSWWRARTRPWPSRAASRPTWASSASCASPERSDFPFVP
ncbi:hypothetical protein, partial [Eggerthella sinensis]|uniref:hypothetical protein n=1 Tax=Eggerthella sinensis TaxID=242230 RepID=UPI0022E21E85